MKIPLNMNQSSKPTTMAAANRVLEQDILSAKKGDWTAKHALERTFMPLITQLAEKRSQNGIELNEYIDAGKRGLHTAAKKYKASVGADRFRIFALDYIEASMNHKDKGGIFFRIFGK